jgi:DNA-binding CsgD family transcriptional regulator
VSTDRLDVVSAVEAAYAIDRSADAWLEGLLAAVRPALDAGTGIVAYFYDVSARPIQPWGFVGQYAMSEEEIVATLQSADSDYVDNSYLVLPFGAASEVPGFDRQPSFPRYMHRYGIYDAVAINALDATGIGCWIGALLPHLRTIRPAEREIWTRVSAHVAAALRLRRRLDGANLRATPDQYADAIVSRRGAIEHLRHLSGLEASRAALAGAARAIERAKGRLRTTDPGQALVSWKALVRARWSLIDQFETGGRRYLLACSNDPASHGPDLLTVRERQVAAHVVLGHSNKEIAYELGLSASTVRVHLARAAQKLGVSTRRQFIQQYRRYLAGTE